MLTARFHNKLLYIFNIKIQTLPYVKFNTLYYLHGSDDMFRIAFIWKTGEPGLAKWRSQPNVSNET